MDREFHYEMTYLIAAMSGFSFEDSRIIAASCQLVDDNTERFTVDPGCPGEFHNYISQMNDLAKPVLRLMRLYPVFHFPPGDPLAESAARKDGRTHPLVTTPGGEHARTMLGRALASRDPYRIGVAAHVFADSYSHQNFTGSYDAYNACPGGLGPAVCHFQAGEAPDTPGLVWTDARLVHDRVDNRTRFLDAARGLGSLFLEAVSPEMKAGARRGKIAGLLEVLDDCMAAGPAGGSFSREACLRRCREVAGLPLFGGAAIPEYDPTAWFDQAVERRESGYFRRNPQAGGQPAWFRFQTAVKTHQGEALSLLAESHFPALLRPDGRPDLRAY